MSVWSVVAFSAPSDGSKGHALGELTSIHNLQFDLNVDKADGISFTMDSRSSEMELLRAPVDVMLYCSDEAVQRYRLKGASGNVAADTHSVSFSGASYKAYLDTQVILPTDTDVEDPVDDTMVFVGYTETDPEEIAWQLIDRIQSRDSYVLMSVTRGSGQSTGLTRGAADEFYKPYSYGQKVGAAIDSVAQAVSGTLSTAEGAFEWDIDASLVFRVWPGERRNVSTFQLVYGDTVSSFNYDDTMTEYANVVTVQGEAPDTVATAYAPDLDILGVGRMDWFEASSNYKTITAAQQRANWLLARHGNIKPSVSVVLSAGAWNSPNDLGLGDMPYTDLQDGYVNIQRTDLRVVRISVAVSDDSEFAIPTIALDHVIPDIYDIALDTKARVDSIPTRR